MLEDIICAVDTCTGRAKCKLMRDKFDYLDDKQVSFTLVPGDVGELVNEFTSHSY